MLEHNSLDHLRHSDFAVFLKGVHHQAVAADVVNALWGGGGGVRKRDVSVRAYTRVFTT